MTIWYGDEYITINNQRDVSNRIERFELSDGSYLTDSDVDLIVQQLSAYGKDHGFSLTNQEQIRQNQEMMNIVMNGWHQ